MSGKPMMKKPQKIKESSEEGNDEGSFNDYK
jgi:hypothetical protein